MLLYDSCLSRVYTALVTQRNISNLRLDIFFYVAPVKVLDSGQGQMSTFFHINSLSKLEQFLKSDIF